VFSFRNIGFYRVTGAQQIHIVGSHFARMDRVEWLAGQLSLKFSRPLIGAELRRI
jgi:hypothetical protein